MVVLQGDPLPSPTQPSMWSRCSTMTIRAIYLMCRLRHVSLTSGLNINNTNAFDVVVCHLDFKSAVLRIDSDNKRNSTILEVKRDGEEGWTSCLEYPASVDFSVHTYISSGGMHNDRRAVTLNSIKFFDNEEEIAEEDAIEDYRKSVDTDAYRNF